jgi:carbonic anhydrase/acetyltransferase-like protein (isoleucine patch superfamily)
VNEPLIMEINGAHPKIGKDTYLAPTAQIIGDVEIGKSCSIWFGAILRGDVFPIRIGDQTNVQDGSVLHGTYKKCGVTLGNRVTIGHAVILHGCNIGDSTLVGMGSIIMDNAKVGKQCIVGAGSLVTENSEFPDGSLILGRPAKLVRPLTDDEKKKLEHSADNYLHYMTWYK